MQGLVFKIFSFVKKDFFFGLNSTRQTVHTHAIIILWRESNDKVSEFKLNNYYYYYYMYTKNIFSICNHSVTMKCKEVNALLDNLPI